MNFGGFHTLEVPFDKDGNLTSLGDVQGAGAKEALLALVPSIDDLIVVSHGWNNDANDARNLYSALFANVQAAWGAAGLSGADAQRTALMAIYWPSKRFDESDLIAGGAAGIGDDDASYDAKIRAQIANLKDPSAQLDAQAQQRLDSALAQLANLESDPRAQDAYVAALAGLFPHDPEERDPGLDVSKSGFADRSGREILADIDRRMSGGDASSGGDGSAGAASGGAAVIGDDSGPSATATSGAAMGFDPLGNAKRAAWMLLNLTTYYTMKTRAGTIGRCVASLLAAALAARPALRVHLAGHSFGGRLVTSIANALPTDTPVRSLALLQAAYSHYGLAPAPGDGSRPEGAFRSVVTQNKVRGPIWITHSCHDWAVGAAYPIASAIARDTASAIEMNVPSTANSAWGGMGANGARQTPEAYDDTLLDGNQTYAALPAGKTIRNLEGSPFIAGHGNITGPQVAWAFLSAFETARQ